MRRMENMCGHFLMALFILLSHRHMLFGIRGLIGPTEKKTGKKRDQHERNKRARGVGETGTRTHHDCISYLQFGV
ncbi:hypothetical protein F5X98DRAFT_226409 [Xylaria grammica]|nr:hypothetical protein F5X98DRAFT_226409 [Xylaria grammica]